MSILFLAAVPPQGIQASAQDEVLYEQSKTPPKPQIGTDSDGDWVSDADEERFGSDASLVDTDSDGMSDFEEIFVLLTDPSEANIDRDSDGFFDQVEEQLFKTDPNQADDDQDGDLLPDVTENLLGSNPQKADSDQDLLSDFVELFLLDSDPTQADLDKDRNGYPDILQAWLPQHLQRTSCQASVTLTVDSLTVIDPEEEDSTTNMSGGDETTVVYGIQVSPPNQPIEFLSNGTPDGDLWSGDAYEGDIFTNFRTLGPLRAKCGEIISVFLVAMELDGFMGGETQMGNFQMDKPLAFTRLPVGWDFALQQEHIFEGTGVDGHYEYAMIYTPQVALGGTPLKGLPQLNEETISLVDNSDTVIPCTADATGGSNLTPGSSRQPREAQTANSQNQPFFFEEQFDDNKGQWTISNYQGTEISNGSLGFDSTILPANLRYYWYPESVSHHKTLRAATQGDFNLEIEFFDFKTAPDPDNFIVSLMVRNLDTGALTNIFQIGNNNRWIFIDFVDEEETETGNLPKEINLLDGDRHSMRWEVTKKAGQTFHTLIVDDIEVASLQRDVDLFGSPVFGFGHNRHKEEDRTASVRVDRFTVTASGANLKPGTGIGPFTEQLTLENERFTMKHPADWIMSSQAEQTSQASNGAVNNVEMFNSTHGFIGASNEMALTIYEPVYVMEETGIIDTTKAELADVLYPFVKAALKETVRSERPKLGIFETIIVCDKLLLRTTVQMANSSMTWVASRNSDETVTITKIQLPKTQVEELMLTPLGMISTLDYIAPPYTVRELDGPAIAAKEFMISMARGNFDDAIDMICTPERLFFSIADFFLSDAFNTSVITNLALEGYKLDDSYRYYETVWIGKDDDGDESAFVRVSGHVVHIHPDGAEKIVAQSRAPIFGRSTIIRVEKENDVWRVCQGAKFKW
ncbi:MAG: hypothetical protein AAF702_33390 [Chloroflexota bacterium]